VDTRLSFVVDGAPFEYELGVVPEPSTLALVTAGGALLLMLGGGKTLKFFVDSRGRRFIIAAGMRWWSSARFAWSLDEQGTRCKSGTAPPL
jgi:hypothetical protein